ncbi:hypothetical protein ALNOE001_05400 [Candidatus Methanobinarius endosymbioticus]|uniref:Uncharacterized protein n=1 Tax=Candidatus Methanobinarius endosymbioticus TaxID=2006182 RepID=A0A366MEV8_9EURY|nr:hypothetical protein ALNOE001_05400 [Candidatus Methanobinarius endosymbioticus]
MPRFSSILKYNNKIFEIKDVRLKSEHTLKLDLFGENIIFFIADNEIQNITFYTANIENPNENSTNNNRTNNTVNKPNNNKAQNDLIVENENSRKMLIIQSLL